MTRFANSCLRLVRALTAGIHEDWQEGICYHNKEFLKERRRECLKGRPTPKAGALWSRKCRKHFAQLFILELRHYDWALCNIQQQLVAEHKPAAEEDWSARLVRLGIRGGRRHSSVRAPLAAVRRPWAGRRVHLPRRDRRDWLACG